jgi:hypothetical protein
MWYDDGGNTPPHAPPATGAFEVAGVERFACCGMYDGAPPAELCPGCPMRDDADAYREAWDRAWGWRP